MDVFTLTDIGRLREENQDFVYRGATKYFPLVMMVADGMGGHAGGSLASRKAVECIAEAMENMKPEPELLRQAVETANLRILEIARNIPAYNSMGTTIVVAACTENRVILAHVGDSRAYLLHEHVLWQLTTDHSYVQYLVEKGKMTQEEARVSPYRNMITRALGMEGLEVDLIEAPLEKGDILLLCSDGLSSYFSNEELQQYLEIPETAEQKARVLLNVALERGGSDNISVALAISGAEGGGSND
jgi:serine/threonine protein phosphatase PrpC